MIQLIALYLLAGTIVGFFLESVVRAVGESFNGWERASVIITWPIMLVVFIFNFIIGFFKGKDDE